MLWAQYYPNIKIKQRVFLKGVREQKDNMPWMQKPAINMVRSNSVVMETWILTSNRDMAFMSAPKMRASHTTISSLQS